MNTRNRKVMVVLLLAGCSLLSYSLWISIRQVKIIAVHQRSSNFSDVLVENFPVTDKGKIAWWLENKKILKNKYKLPNSGSEGSFYITFWLFGDGYKKESKYDRLCFTDMKTENNCIDKNAVFSVEDGREGSVIFTLYNGTYRMEKNGKIIKVQRQ